MSGKLLEELAVVQQCAHWAVVQSAIVGHVTAAKQNGWTLPKLQPLPEEQEASPESISATPSKLMTMKIKGMTPYWIDRARAIDNDLDLTGTFLLTAPNMSGKSTIMRASLVVALLANCGLFVPAQYASIPRYDSFFLRTASYDVPSESKSAFGLECDDVKVLTRDYTSRSLIMIDELGKGTSARDGAALAGALLEALDDCGCSGIFATHLHEVFQLPLVLNRVTYKRMGIEQVDESRESDDKRWTYKLEDGKCIDSLALQTARQYNIPLSIIKRAEQLAAIFDDTCRGGKPILSSSTGTLSSSSTITTISAYETKRLSTPSVTLSEEQDQVYVSTEKELEMTTTDVTAASMSTVIVDTPRKVWTSSRVIYGPKTCNLSVPISPSISSTLPSTPPSTTPVASVFSPRPKPAAISPATTDDPLYSAKREIVLDTLITLFKRLSGLKQIPIIESDMIPPPSLEGQAAVYVLHIQSVRTTIYRIKFD